MTKAIRHRAIAHPLQSLNPVPLLQSASKQFAEWRQCRIAVRELQNLDHRMLKDIGLGRSEILAAAYGTLGRTARHVRDTNSKTTHVRYADIST